VAQLAQYIASMAGAKLFSAICRRSWFVHRRAIHPQHIPVCRPRAVVL